MKRIIVSVLTLILTLSVGLFVACAPQAKPSTTLTLNKTSLSVEKYMNAFVIAEYNGSAELTWTSANEAIATVEDGRVYGVAVGSTKVTVTDGSLKADCAVTVVAPDPAKFAISVGGDFSLFLGAQKTLSPVLTYNNVPISGVEFTYSTESSNITLSNDGVVTANAVGLAVIKVEGEVDGTKVSEEINVEVQDEYAVEIQQSNVVLYPFASYNGVSYNNDITCTAGVLHGGEPISVSQSDIKWSVPEGQDVITVDENGKVTALNGGSAILTASYEVDGKVIVGEMLITVSPVEVAVEGAVLEAGLTTPFKPEISNYVDVNESVSKIIVNASGLDEVEILPENGVFDMSAFNSGNAIIKLITRNFAYSFNAVIYDGVISNAEEMKALLSAESGMYKIVADIDMAEYVADGADQENANVWSSTASFNGVIDGGNHVIRNFNTSTGLFKNYNGGQIKDIAFTDVVTKGAVGVFGDHNRAEAKPIEIDNVYVSLSTNTGGWYVGLFGSMNLRETLKISNTVMVSTKVGYGALVGRVGSYAITLDNCYLISTSVYRQSLNTNMSEEEQQKAHNPATNVYKSYANSTEAYIAYTQEPFALGEFVGGLVEELMNEYAKEILVLTNDNVAELLTFTGKTVLVAEDIDMATAYTENGGVWTSSLSFYGTFDGQGHTIKNLKTNTGLFYKLNGKFQNVVLDDVVATGNCGAIAKGYVRTGVSDVWVENVVVDFVARESACDWYFGLFGDVNIGSPIYLKNVYFNSAVAGRAYIYGEVGSGAIDMQNCWFVGLAKEYARSLNSNLDAEGQRKLHLPEDNDYHFFKTSHDLYYDYSNNEYELEGLIKEAIEADLAGLEGHERVIKSDEQSHWYECSCGFVYTQSVEEHYGEASCTETGNCEICGKTYGGKHVYEKLDSDATYHWYNCKWCDTPGEKEEHFGGTATCTEQAKCEVCQTPHGELHNYSLSKYDEDYHWTQCSGCELTTEKEAHFGGVASTTEKAVCEGCKQPYGELKPDFININKDNVALLLTAIDGKYYITEDIDMATAYTENGGIWTSTAVFNGLLDGQGHTIKNLNTNTGLFKTFNGTLANIAFEDATVTGGTGIIAKDYARNAGKLEIENVFVSYSNANTAWLAGGLFCQINVGSPVTLKNVYLFTPAKTNAGNGLFAMSVAGKVIFENCYFVGYDGKLSHSHYEAQGWIPNYQGTYGAYANQTDFTTAYLAGKVTLSGMVAEKVEKLLDVKKINSSNVKDLLTATTGVYMLTEDIDMATAYTENGGVWASTAVFEGVLAGAGHTVKNFNTSTGLFKTLKGVVKDVAFVDAKTTLASGLIAYGTVRNIGKTVTVENVFISYASTPTGYLAGGIFRSLNTGDTTIMIIKDCFVSIPGVATNGNALFTGSLDDAKTTLTFENCYFVGLDGKIAYSGNSATYAFTGYKSYADMDAFNSDSSKTLTEFMTKNLAK